MATDFWVVAKGKRVGSPTVAKSSGNINFGLFKGMKRLDSGLGERIFTFKVTDLPAKQPAFMIYSVWMATIGTLCAAIVFTIIVVVFGIINTAVTPVEFITGVPGLYVWHGIAAFFECCSLVLWSVQFYSRLQYSVFWASEQQQGWSSQDMASFGYSFWLVVGALCCHLVCVLLLCYSGRALRLRKVNVPIDTGPNSAVNMIY